MKGPSYKDKFALANILGPLSIGLVFYYSPSVFKLQESPGNNLPSLFCSPSSYLIM